MFEQIQMFALNPTDPLLVIVPAQKKGPDMPHPRDPESGYSPIDCPSMPPRPAVLSCTDL